MPTTKTILDEVEQRLHDPANKIWARRELLDDLNEGYRDMAARTAMIATFAAFNSPGRWGYAATYLWEIEEVRPARAWLPTLRYSDVRWRATYKWELEELDGRTPTNSGICFTQPWELAHKPTDRILPFPLPENHVKTIRPAWNFRRIDGTTVREADALRYKWYTDTGLPQWLWADTLGTKQFGIFPLHAGYIQAYALTGTAPFGTPRQFTGDRTYSFASLDSTQIFGIPRTFSGRDYVAIDANGTPRGWGSTEDALGIIYARIPVPLILESESPGEVHPRVAKYLRSYVLAQAFDRQGPGKNPTLAAYYKAHYGIGLALFKKIADALMRDIHWLRETEQPSRRRPPRVQFPPEFEQVLR